MTMKEPTKTRGLVIIDSCPLCQRKFQVSAVSVTAAWANLQDHFDAVHQADAVPVRVAS